MNTEEEKTGLLRELDAEKVRLAQRWPRQAILTFWATLQGGLANSHSVTAPQRGFGCRDPCVMELQCLNRRLDRRRHCPGHRRNASNHLPHSFEQSRAPSVERPREVHPSVCWYPRYRELVRIGRERRHIQLVGEDRKATVLTYTNNDKLNPGWIQRAVLGVEADDFRLENLTVQNTTPFRGSQAEAVTLNAERCVLRNANFLSCQDTLNLSGRVYVSDCYIEGDVDYVWGYGTACFERCELRSMHDGYIVQARNSGTRAGYVFLDCRLTAATEVKKVWLARIETTRFPESHVAFIRCAMGSNIRPAGWQIMGNANSKLRFEEFGTTDLNGKPLDLSARDAATKLMTTELAATLSARTILSGPDGWVPPAAPMPRE